MHFFYIYIMKENCAGLSKQEMYRCANLIFVTIEMNIEHQTTLRNIAWMQIFKIFSWKKTLKLQDGVFPSRASV